MWAMQGDAEEEAGPGPRPHQPWKEGKAQCGAVFFLQSLCPKRLSKGIVKCQVKREGIGH